MKHTLLWLTITLIACHSGKNLTRQPDQNTYHVAVELAHRTIITDTHIDLPEWLEDRHFDPDTSDPAIILENTGDLDYQRALQGGLSAPFMSIYIPSSYQEKGKDPQGYARHLIQMVERVIKTYPDKFAPGLSPEMIESNFQKGLISLPMGMENGAPLLHLDDVNAFYAKGIRYVTLTHATDNHICDSSYDTTGTWQGLSPYGREIIRRMNEVGMIIDVSHVTDQTFYQVMEISKAPVLATHSSCRYFTPGWQRNMSDDMIRTLAAHGGVIQINFGSNFLDSTVVEKRKQRDAAWQKELEKSGLKSDDPKVAALLESFNKKHPEVFSDVQRVADHIDHVRDIAGIDFVGIGSDFDGVGNTLPTGLKDVSMYPNLIAELLRRDYSEEDIEKICYKNTWRVWNKVNEIASAR